MSKSTVQPILTTQRLKSHKVEDWCGKSPGHDPGKRLHFIAGNLDVHKHQTVKKWL
jgi:hypothetical protein